MWIHSQYSLKVLYVFPVLYMYEVFNKKYLYRYRHRYLAFGQMWFSVHLEGIQYIWRTVGISRGVLVHFEGHWYVHGDDHQDICSVLRLSGKESQYEEKSFLTAILYRYYLLINSTFTHWQFDHSLNSVALFSYILMFMLISFLC